jgi:hypothetical protein
VFLEFERILPESDRRRDVRRRLRTEHHLRNCPDGLTRVITCSSWDSLSNKNRSPFSTPRSRSGDATLAVPGAGARNGRRGPHAAPRPRVARGVEYHRRGKGRESGRADVAPVAYTNGLRGLLPRGPARISDTRGRDERHRGDARGASGGRANGARGNAPSRGARRSSLRAVEAAQLVCWKSYAAHREKRGGADGPSPTTPTRDPAQAHGPRWMAVERSAR